MWEWAALTPPSPRSPSNGSSRKLSVDEMYLADTGGQYLCVDLNVDLPALCRTPPTSSPCSQHRVVAGDPQSQRWGLHLPPFTPSLHRDGTTDITRTVHWGVPTPLQKVPAPLCQPAPPVCPAPRSRPGLGVPGGVRALPRSAPVPCPSQEAYTRVLMGNIDLARLIFPPNTAGGC